MTLWEIDLVIVLVLIFLGLYCLLSKRNMIKMIIGIEVLSKGVTLSFISSGRVSGNIGISQALVIITILIDVVIVAIALSLIVSAYGHYGTLDASKLRRLRG